jgi:hypothetical protein
VSTVTLHTTMDLSRHNKLVFVTVTKQPVRNSWSPNLGKGNCVICQQIRAAELIRLAGKSSHTRRQEDAAIQDEWWVTKALPANNPCLVTAWIASWLLQSGSSRRTKKTSIIVWGDKMSAIPNTMISTAHLPTPSFLINILCYATLHK